MTWGGPRARLVAHVDDSEIVVVVVVVAQTGGSDKRRDRGHHVSGEDEGERLGTADIIGTGKGDAT